MTDSKFIGFLKLWILNLIIKKGPKKFNIIRTIIIIVKLILEFVEFKLHNKLEILINTGILAKISVPEFVTNRY